MGQLTQAVSPRDTSRAPEFKTPSLKAPDPFYGTKPYKLRGYIQSCQLIFHNDPENVFSDRKKVLYSTFFITSDFRSLISRIGDWGESFHIHLYRGGLEARFLDQLASFPVNFHSLQELMDIALELDTRYHERQKEKGIHQGKQPPISGSNSSKPPQNSSSKRPYHRKNKKGKSFQVSKDKPHAALLTKENKLIGYEKEGRIKEGLCTYCGGKHPIQKCFERPENGQGLSRGFPSKQGKALVGIMMC
ncbi:hypothetical protein O181_073206 [Austropuccinia psidii MF-1]|uniref:Retrotransposon gag domain-containing protein n=1 Tax=Austropuccinia psidii MF-1 TaxID=1389203 RepID=A0A9Q3F459_9BASI|nr:hypothetical protein [Austropuccinia psidii MF-1]